MSAKRIKKGFTLIELLVVISIIALLISILMPALNKAREQATGSVCLGNQKNLMLAYIMYADENDGRVVGSYVPRSDQTSRFVRHQWVFSPQADDGSPRDFYGGTVPTLQDRINGLKAGKLWKYLKTHEVYHCPGDNRVRKGTRNAAPDKRYFYIYRSYSLPDVLAATSDNQISYIAKPFRKFDQIKNPTRRYSFVEVAYAGNTSFIYNHGGWSFQPWPNGYVDGRWWDPLGYFHNRAASFSFFDGHAEMHHWVHEGTWEFFQNPSSTGSSPNPPIAVNEDIKWLWMQYPEYHRYPY